MSKVTAQTGHRSLQMTDAVHDLFELLHLRWQGGLKGARPDAIALRAQEARSDPQHLSAPQHLRPSAPPDPQHLAGRIQTFGTSVEATVTQNWLAAQARQVNS